MALNLQLKMSILAAGYPSQRDFAYRIGIDARRLSDIVRGWVEPTAAQRAAIAAALGKSEEYLFRHQTATPPVGGL